MIEEGNLPTEVAQEPTEEARLSQGDENPTSEFMLPKKKTRKEITFAEAAPSEQGSQTSTNTYKDVLSQPAGSISHVQRLQWLQRRRSPGLWVQCDACDRWRFLPHVIDAHQLPDKWHCEMNPDKSAASCSVPEAPLQVREEEDLIHGSYSAGSVVWARLAGWPWWPAMVDDCPDTEQYYWLDGFSDIPTHYNVVFFDTDATRAWISPENLLPYREKNKIKLSKLNKYRKRLQLAITQAEDADKLSLKERLSKYSFISRYNGEINEPRKITKHELMRFQKRMKNMYDIDFPYESDDDEKPTMRKETMTVIKKNENVLLVGTPKSKKNLKRSKSTPGTTKGGKKRDRKLKENTMQENVESSENGIEENKISDKLILFKQPDSLLAQVRSTVTSTVVDVTFDNDTSATYVPESGSENDSNIIRDAKKRAESPNSDDFEF